jgi:hypothetical protein
MSEVLKIITDFLSNHMLIVAFMFGMFLFRKPISDLITRVTKFNYNNGNSTFGVEAEAPSQRTDHTKGNPSADEKPASNEKDSKIDEIKVNEKVSFAEIHVAFDEGRFDDAENAYTKYLLEENDKAKRHKYKGAYLYLRFVKAKDNSAIEDLEDLARNSKTEDSKFDSLAWLSLCFSHSMEYAKKIELWRSFLIEINADALKTKVIIILATALNENDKSSEAKIILIERLSAVIDEVQKSTLYGELSIVEKSLGNHSLSIYCKDKSLEFDANNRDELFNSAYDASEKDIDEISISNYVKLINIDENNSIALNNLGVRALDAGLRTIAIEKYKTASGLNNTLAMANQGYELLNSGYADEAEKLATQALNFDNPHKNVFSLVTAINEKREKENKDWIELIDKSLERQKIIRKYTEQFYLGNSKSLEGDWFVMNNWSTTIVIVSGVMKATWVESAGLLSGVSSTSELVGKVSGSTFEGKFTRKKNDSTQESLLTGLRENTNQSCIGYISEDGNQIIITSSKLEDDFSLNLSKTKV